MKMITKYEVEGCWTRTRDQHTNCRVCGARLLPVPATGHYNSRYLKLRRTEEEALVCCPNGCDVKEAEMVARLRNVTRGYIGLDGTFYDPAEFLALVTEGHTKYRGLLARTEIAIKEDEFRASGFIQVDIFSPPDSEFYISWHKRPNMMQRMTLKALCLAKNVSFARLQARLTMQEMTLCMKGSTPTLEPEGRKGTGNIWITAVIYDNCPEATHYYADFVYASIRESIRLYSLDDCKRWARCRLRALAVDRNTKIYFNEEPFTFDWGEVETCPLPATERTVTEAGYYHDQKD